MRGLYAILLLIPSYAEALGRIKFDIASVYFLGKKKATIGEMVFLLNFIAIITSAIIILLFLIQYDWIYLKLYQNVKVDMHLLTFTILGIIPLRFISSNYTYILIYLEDIKTYNRMVILNSLISSVLGVFFLVVLDWGIWGVLLGSILGLFISIIYGFLKVSSLEKMVPFYNVFLIWEMAVYGFQHYISGILGHLQEHLINLLTAIYLLPSQVAFFSMGKSQGANFTSMIPKAVNFILFPRVSKSNKTKNNIELTLRSFRVIFLILLSLGLVLAIIAKPLVFVIYGEDYLPMVLPFLTMLPGFIFSQSTSVFSSYFAGVGRPNLIPKISVIPLIIQIILSVVLMPKIGMQGAAISFLISNILLSLINLIVFFNLTSTNFSHCFINKNDLSFVMLFIKNKIKA